jgi:hypothetical protein
MSPADRKGPSSSRELRKEPVPARSVALSAHVSIVASWFETAQSASSP